MPCQDAAKLLREYSSAAGDAAQSARELADSAGSATGGDFAVLAREKVRANIRLRRARIEYEQHMTKHGCGEYLVQNGQR